MSDHPHVKEALQILVALGLPRAQQNERSALCLLALLNLTPNKSWAEAESPLMGITPMMDFSRDHYGKRYAPNSRETFRRFTIHQFVSSGIVTYNPDDLDRPVNSPKAVYQIESEALSLLRSFGTKKWDSGLNRYLAGRQTLAQRYAKERKLKKIPIKIASGKNINISPGSHSKLTKAIIESFAPRFVPAALPVYVGDTGEKWGYFDEELLAKLGVVVDSHGKMPDVVLYDQDRNWLLLVEAVTSHGPVNAKRHEELAAIFTNSSAGCVYVTAFPSRAVMARYLGLVPKLVAKGS